MSSSVQRPAAEPASIAGPAGNLEALVETLPGAGAQAVGVICHPHPLHGGTMTNKVVHMLARAFNELGAVAVRFNFRGVGRSEGAYDEGRGETEDALAVLDWAALRWPARELWLAGFSFGGAVAIRAAVQRDVKRLVTVAPAIRRVAVDVSTAAPTCPWLVVQGDQDDLVDARDTAQWIERLPARPQLALLAGADHFFHGRLNDLRREVLDWVERSSGAAR